MLRTGLDLSLDLPLVGAASTLPSSASLEESLPVAGTALAYTTCALFGAALFGAALFGVLHLLGVAGSCS